MLNADFRPLSYFPLSLLPWQDAVSAVIADKVSVVAEYGVVARSTIQDDFSGRLTSVKPQNIIQHRADVAQQ